MPNSGEQSGHGQNRAREEAQELRSKTFRWGVDCVMYPTLLGSVKCVTEDINALWGEHPLICHLCRRCMPTVGS
eukprot:1111577-Pelagomonas_calceolata.AAC.1